MLMTLSPPNHPRLPPLPPLPHPLPTPHPPTTSQELIEHLDNKKDEALERSFKTVTEQFIRTFRELVPGGEGTLIMAMRHNLDRKAVDARTRVANYTGVTIKVRFPGGSEVRSMSQLSGGQKTMVALCLIFAIQRCDPAPFYIFDEIDAALDATHRAALAKMIERQSTVPDDDAADDKGDDTEASAGGSRRKKAAGEERKPTQFITTTFRPELIRSAEQCYGVTHARKASTIRSIEPDEALRVIAEDTSRQRQHIGVA